MKNTVGSYHIKYMTDIASYIKNLRCYVYVKQLTLQNIEEYKQKKWENFRPSPVLYISFFNCVISILKSVPLDYFKSVVVNRLYVP